MTLCLFSINSWFLRNSTSFWKSSVEDSGKKDQRKEKEKRDKVPIHKRWKERKKFFQPQERRFLVWLRAGDLERPREEGEADLLVGDSFPPPEFDLDSPRGGLPEEETLEDKALEFRLLRARSPNDVRQRREGQERKERKERKGNNQLLKDWMPRRVFASCTALSGWERKDWPHLTMEA